MEVTVKKTSVSLSFPCTAVWALTAFVLPYSVFCAAALAVILHESTHLLLMYLFHVPPLKLTVGIFGMRLTLPSQPILSYKKEFISTLSAPLVNLLLFFLFLFLYRLSNGRVPVYWAAAQLGTGIINLFPFRFLDGGHALECFLLMHFDADKTEKLMRKIQLFCIPLPIISCVFALHLNPMNYTAPVFAVYLLFLLILHK